MSSESSQGDTPKEVIVGPYRYKVCFDSEAAYDYHYLGVCLYGSRRLKLDPRQADTELPQTMMHEILHALGNAYGITEWDRHKTDEHGDITDKIDLMATALLTYIRSNPDVIKWMQSQL